METTSRKDFKRIQALGQRLTFQLSKLFRNLTGGSKNMVGSYDDLTSELREVIQTSFRELKGCSLRVTRQSVHIVERRIFIEKSMLEPVQHLAGLFERIDIGGISFSANFVEETDLPKNLIALANVMVREPVSGVVEVQDALSGYDCYKITALDTLEEETFPSTMIDERHAAQYAMRNALKLIYFLEQMNEAVNQDVNHPMDAAYRVILNLIRVNERYPRYIRGLLNIDLPMKDLRIQFYTAILLLTVFRQLRLSRQIQLDLVVNSLYHFIGTEKAQPLRSSGDTNLALRQLFHTTNITRGFYYRVNFAYYVPRNDNPVMLLPITRFLKTVAAFAKNQRSEPGISRTAQETVSDMLKAADDDLDMADTERQCLILIAKSLGLAPEGSLTIYEKEKAMFVTRFEDRPTWSLQLEQVPAENQGRGERTFLEMGSETDRKAALRKTGLVVNQDGGSTFTKLLFPEAVFLDPTIEL